MLDADGRPRDAARESWRDEELVVGLLVEKMAGVGVSIAAGAIVSAPHVRTNAKPMARKSFPLQVGRRRQRI